MFLFLFSFFCFLGLHLWHMEVPGLGVESELQLLVCTAATATRDLSCICNIHHSSSQCWILNLLSGALTKQEQTHRKQIYETNKFMVTERGKIAGEG